LIERVADPVTLTRALNQSTGNLDDVSICKMATIFRELYGSTRGLLSPVVMSTAGHEMALWTLWYGNRLIVQANRFWILHRFNLQETESHPRIDGPFVAGIPSRSRPIKNPPAPPPIFAEVGGRDVDGLVAGYSSPAG
jgi:hypothetical protein